MCEEPIRPAGDGLLLRAVLYTSGGLTPEEAAAFEQRLECDAAAQDALCQAVRLSERPGNRGTVRPTSAYRKHLRHRLRRPDRVPRRVRDCVPLGAAVAAALLLLVGIAPKLTQPASPVSDTAELPAGAANAASALAVARCWADLFEPAESHLARVRQEASDRARAADAPDDAVHPQCVWAVLNDGAHLSRAHDEVFRRLADSSRRREAGLRAPNPAPRPHL